MSDHRDHWKEPESITNQRPAEEKWCESCGEEIPYHDVSCRLLKTAYQTRKRKCDYCLKVLQVGGEMFDHVIAEHRDELKKRGVILPKKCDCPAHEWVGRECTCNCDHTIVL